MPNGNRRSPAIITSAAQRRRILNHLFWLIFRLMDMRKGIICIRDVAINSLDLGLIFQFSGSVFVSNIMETSKRIFMVFAGYAWHDMTNNWLDCLTPNLLFHGFPSRRDGVLVSIITIKWMNGSWWNFQDRLAMIQGIFWKSWWYCVKPLRYRIFFLLSGSVLVSNAMK